MSEMSWKVEILETPDRCWHAKVRNPKGDLVLLTPTHPTRTELVASLDQFSVWMGDLEGYWDEHFVETPSDKPLSTLRSVVSQITEMLDARDAQIAELADLEDRIETLINIIKRTTDEISDTVGPAAP